MASILGPGCIDLGKTLARSRRTSTEKGGKGEGREGARKEEEEEEEDDKEEEGEEEEEEEEEEGGERKRQVQSLDSLAIPCKR